MINLTDNLFLILSVIGFKILKLIGHIERPRETGNKYKTVIGKP
jgi:hypothetical protein